MAAAARVTVLLVAAMAAVGLARDAAPPSMPPSASEGPARPWCAWTPPATPRSIAVKTVRELYDAAARATAGTTILVADGEYRLDRMVDLSTPDVVLRGAGRDPAKAVIRGAGMTEQQIGVAVSISAPGITVADVTIGYVGFHGIQIRGERGASRTIIHNVRIVDTGQQLIKGSTDGGSRHADDGLVACSSLEYSDHAPSDYTNGIDVLAGSGWTVRDNTLRRIRGPIERRYAAGPAILFWANSQRTLIERNLVIDSSRGIALGIGAAADPRIARDHQTQYDHQDGWIRNNVVVNLNPWADEGIEANGARATRIDHNTVMTTGQLPWSISVRFASTDAQVRNNLTARAITKRDGGTGVVSGNVAGALASWFVNLGAGDARLVRGDLPAVDAGVLVADIGEDMARRPRASGLAPDAGAFERER
jgi:hypothetical protein